MSLPKEQELFPLLFDPWHSQVMHFKNNAFYDAIRCRFFLKHVAWDLFTLYYVLNFSWYVVFVNVFSKFLRRVRLVFHFREFDPSQWRRRGIENCVNRRNPGTERALNFVYVESERHQRTKVSGVVNEPCSCNPSPSRRRQSTAFYSLGVMFGEMKTTLFGDAFRAQRNRSTTSRLLKKTLLILFSLKPTSLQSTQQHKHA